MPDFRELVPAERLPEFVALLLSPRGPMPLFAVLTKREQADVVEGRADYSEYEHQPILRYVATAPSA